MTKKTATKDKADAKKATGEVPADPQEQLFALAFHVHAAIRRCDEAWEQAQGDPERAAVAVFARNLRDDLRAAVSGAPLPPRTPADESALALQVCGMLALLLAKKHSGFKNGTTPNASSIAEKAAEATEEVLGSRPRGLGDTRVRSTIARGVAALRGAPADRGADVT